MSGSESSIQNFLLATLEIFSVILLVVLTLILVAVIVTYIFDITQTKTAIRRNYPVIGHFRYFFEHLGEFFRQYFFAMDREELPFNR
ncbi:MAG: FMN-binding glutamate synthase family protein, partial [Candidatus Thiodiazotropha weberae]|nr:FMN-binding glutamate synthase family protein [Candidatus Thiodiazotropha weberae]